MATSQYTVDKLHFGDLTSDGKTDVLGYVDDKWQIVPGGTSYWQPLAGAQFGTSGHLALADFDGDGTADVLWAIPSSGWYFSKSGTSPLVLWYATQIQPLLGSAIGSFDTQPGADLVFLDRSNGLKLKLLNRLSTTPTPWGFYLLR
ncbi:MAG: VCBS repeat-containing protein [Polyangiaceae bacterium]